MDRILIATPRDDQRVLLGRFVVEPTQCVALDALSWLVFGEDVADPVVLAWPLSTEQRYPLTDLLLVRRCLS